MATPTIDYDALAEQARKASPQVDYDAMAAQVRGSSYTPEFRNTVANLSKQNIKNAGADQKALEQANEKSYLDLSFNPKYRSGRNDLLVEEVGSGAKAGIKGLYEFGKKIAAPPKNSVEVALSFTPGGIQAKRALIDPRIEASDKADKAAAQGNSADAIRYSTEAAVPGSEMVIEPVKRLLDDPQHATSQATEYATQYMAPKVAIPAAVRGVKMAMAEGDPGVVYNRYLNARGDVPAEVPPTTPHIDRALVRKVEINYPEVAARMEEGTTNIKDLDIVRQVANDASKAAYTARGLPTQISKGFKGAADKVRSNLYPKIDSLQNLPEGTSGKLKGIQAESVEMGRPPKWGHFPTRWPTVAAERLAIRPALAAARNIRTRYIDSGLPEPQGPPKVSQRPPAGLLGPGPIEMGSGPDASGTVRNVAVPPVEGTTRAVRKGLLLPEKAGGKIELKPGDPMAGRELTEEELLKLLNAN